MAAFGAVCSSTGGGEALARSQGANPHLGLGADPVCKSRVCPGRAPRPPDTGLVQPEYLRTGPDPSQGRRSLQAAVSGAASQGETSLAAPQGWTPQPAVSHSCPRPLLSAAAGSQHPASSRNPPPPPLPTRPEGLSLGDGLAVMAMGVRVMVVERRSSTGGAQAAPLRALCAGAFLPRPRLGLLQHVWGDPGWVRGWWQGLSSSARGESCTSGLLKPSQTPPA